jgi:subtilisin family serine protease
MRWGLTGLIFFLAWMTAAVGQRLDAELIVQTRWSDSNPDAWTAFGDCRVARLGADIFHLTFPDSATAVTAHSALRKLRGIAAVQYNYRVRFRATPNDPRYGEQEENYRRAGYEDMWFRTTGGQTISGTPIVTAILDSGFDAEHEDLLPNLWRNPGETAGDGVDNDRNGFIDDLHGWDFISGSPAFPVTTHGTSVAGILGARGDNGVGVAGSNWQASLMLFSIETVAEVVAAYEYILEQRRIFRSSGGQRGAFVVATNASFGVEGASCTDFPVWGAMYDRLGQEGILTAASVVNVDRDVENFGDMPVDCPSEFLIGVTNLDQDDRRFPSAGFGRLSVDLGAPGEGSFTTLPDNRYGTFGSTSAAAPYVTGAIGLLYALDCDRLLEQALTDPPAAALRVRSALLTSVRTTEALENITVTGGVIDVAAAADRLLADCVTPAAETSLVAFPNPAVTRLTLQTDTGEFAGIPRLTLYTAGGTRIVPADGYTASSFPAAVGLDVNDLPAGLYVAELQDDQRSWQTTIIVK